MKCKPLLSWKKKILMLFAAVVIDALMVNPLKHQSQLQQMTLLNLFFNFFLRK